MPTWPSALPQAFPADAYREAFEDRRIIARTETGPGKVRPRGRASLRRLEVGFEATASQVATLRTFYGSDTLAGATRFTFPHPRKDGTVEARFIRPPRLRPYGGDLWEAALALDYVVPPTAGLGALVWPPPLQPSRLPNLRLWLDASQITGLSDGDPVEVWPDASGNGADAAQATSANRPIYKTNVLNGRPVLRFDGTNDVLMGSLGLAIGLKYHIFVVAKRVTNNCGVFDIRGNGVSACVLRQGSIFSGGGDWQHRSHEGGGFQAFPVIIMGQTDYRIAELRNDDGALTTWLEGVEQDTATLGGSGISGTGPFTIGAAVGPTNFMNGDIAEIVLFSQPLAEDDRHAIERYLGLKYGLSFQETGTLALPLAPLIKAYDEQFADLALIGDDLGSGLPEIRRRTTAAAAPLRTTFRLTGPQVETLEKFYEGDTVGGCLPFTWTHPRDGEVRTAFAGGPEVRALGGDLYDVVIPLEVLP